MSRKGRQVLKFVAAACSPRRYALLALCIFFAGNAQATPEECEEAVAEMEEEMLRDLGPEERETFYRGLVSSVRRLHAGFPEH